MKRSTTPGQRSVRGLDTAASPADDDALPLLVDALAPSPALEAAFADLPAPGTASLRGAVPAPGSVTARELTDRLHDELVEALMPRADSLIHDRLRAVLDDTLSRSMASVQESLSAYLIENTRDALARAIDEELTRRRPDARRANTNG